MFKAMRAHLSDNRGDENISKMIWVAIVFVVGAILLVLVTSAFQNPIKTWFETTVKAWFNKDTTGKYPTSANTNPSIGN